MSGGAGQERLPVEIAPDAAALIDRRAAVKGRVLVVDWLHASA